MKHILAILMLTCTVHAAEFRTVNFIVTAPTEAEAQSVGEAAEQYRDTIAQYWFGRTFPRWTQPAKVNVRSGVKGNGGSTGFHCEGGDCWGWSMTLQGTSEAIVESVLPHEIQHTIFASHFGRYLPRWLDEGAATLFESETEKSPAIGTLRQIAHTREWAPLSQWVTLGTGDYPNDGRRLAILYAEGHGVVDYLVQLKGPAVFVEFVDTGLRSGWPAAFQRHYSKSVADVDRYVQAWTVAGNPDLHQVTAIRSATEAAEAGGVKAVAYTDPSYCSHCRTMAAIFERLSKLHDLTTSTDFTANGVDRIPCVVFLRDGKEISRLIGLQSESTIEAILSGRTTQRIVYQPATIFGGYPRGYRPPVFREKYKSRGVGIGVVGVGIGVGVSGYDCETIRPGHTGTLDCPICYPPAPSVRPDPVVRTIKGDRGDTGPPGPRGDKGDRGPEGPTGPATEFDYDRFAALFFERYGEQLRGADGLPGRDGTNGRDGAGGSTDVSDLVARLTKLEVPRRVVLIDGQTKAIIDDESYQPHEAIVLDIRRIMKAAK